jgi:glycosyltransferase involved in cell wall biosynthesis
MQNHKKNAIVSFILLYLIPLSTISSENLTHPLEKIKNPSPLSTTVIIPCHHAHAQFLYDALLSYTYQTVLPDEIVISLSGTDKIPEILIESITKKSWPFKTVLLLSETPQTEGQNRNNACQHANGQILICHDADDFPSIQRVEIIRYFFENYDIVHLLHSFNLFQPNIELSKLELFKQILPDFAIIKSDLSLVNAKEQGPHYSDFTLINKALCHTYDDIWKAGFPVGFGFCAIRKEAFEAGCHWLDVKEIGTDLKFTDTVLNKFQKTLAIQATIYNYRQYNSIYIYGDTFSEKIQQIPSPGSL